MLKTILIGDHQRAGHSRSPFIKSYMQEMCSISCGKVFGGSNLLLRYLFYLDSSIGENSDSR